MPLLAMLGASSISAPPAMMQAPVVRSGEQFAPALSAERATRTFQVPAISTRCPSRAGRSA